VKAGGARPRPAEIVAVDCHAHVMRRDAPLAPYRTSTANTPRWASSRRPLKLTPQ
jgi:hypothetical protein